MRYLIFCLLFLGLFSCKKEKNEWASPKVILEMAYGLDPQQKMDLYLPKDRSPENTPLLILIHGGGWIEGDKKDFTPFVSEIQKRFPNYAIANVNYRLHKFGSNFTNGIHPFPTQEQDVARAVKALRDQSAIEGYSDTTIALLGASAGGHLALMNAYKNTDPVKAKAVISFFGPTELVNFYNNTNSNPLAKSLLASLTGTTPADNILPYRLNSPVEFVFPSSSPTLLFHGGQDLVVHSSQSTTLRQKCIENGVPVEYYFYPNESHGWTGPNLDDSFNKLEAFLRKYMR